MRQLVTPPRVTREYETIFIVRSDALEDERTKVIDRFEGIIGNLDGYVLRKEEWGKRKLAYRIQKHAQGNYFYYRYLGYTDLVGELERNLRILEPVLKYLTILIDEVDRDERIEASADEARAEAEAAEAEEAGDDEAEAEEADDDDDDESDDDDGDE